MLIRCLGIPSLIQTTYQLLNTSKALKLCKCFMYTEADIKAKFYVHILQMSNLISKKTGYKSILVLGLFFISAHFQKITLIFGSCGFPIL